MLLFSCSSMACSSQVARRDLCQSLAGGGSFSRATQHPAPEANPGANPHTPHPKTGSEAASVRVVRFGVEPIQQTQRHISMPALKKKNMDSPASCHEKPSTICSSKHDGIRVSNAVSTAVLRVLFPQFNPEKLSLEQNVISHSSMDLLQLHASWYCPARVHFLFGPEAPGFGGAWASPGRDTACIQVRPSEIAQRHEARSSEMARR